MFIYAEETNKFATVNGKVKEIYTSFQDIGFDTNQLLDVLKSSKENDFWETATASNALSKQKDSKIPEPKVEWFTAENVSSILVEDNEDMPLNQDDGIMPLDGSYYDGNPPYSTAEQEDRMNYLWGVYNKYYSASKYSPNPYLIYLYISHYTENVNYDRTAATPNFDSVYAHIICKTDITYFNTFIKNSQFAEAAATIANIGQAYAIINSVENGAALYTGELESAEEEFAAGVGIVQTLASIETEKNPDFKISDVSKAFSDNYESAENAEDLIIRMNEQLLNSGDLDDLVNEYVDSIKGVMINSAFSSVGPGIIDGIFGAAEMLDTAVSVANLAQLYYTYHIRTAERMSIYYGLDPWP